mmetsp:Transcript_6157/g.13652  ORF Transcript_6157/g.13652 Transcript_6157/m.13652 type:complete len:234 (+) Transcript_6157:761-1462(+)
MTVQNGPGYAGFGSGSAKPDLQEHERPSAEHVPLPEHDSFAWHAVSHMIPYRPESHWQVVWGSRTPLLLRLHDPYPLHSLFRPVFASPSHPEHVSLVPPHTPHASFTFSEFGTPSQSSITDPRANSVKWEVSIRRPSSGCEPGARLIPLSSHAHAFRSMSRSKYRPNGVWRLPLVGCTVSSNSAADLVPLAYGSFISMSGENSSNSTTPPPKRLTSIATTGDSAPGITFASYR